MSDDFEIALTLLRGESPDEMHKFIEKNSPVLMPLVDLVVQLQEDIEAMQDKIDGLEDRLEKANETIDELQDD